MLLGSDIDVELEVLEVRLHGFYTGTGGGWLPRSLRMNEAGVGRAGIIGKCSVSWFPSLTDNCDSDISYCIYDDTNNLWKMIRIIWPTLCSTSAASRANHVSV